MLVLSASLFHTLGDSVESYARFYLVSFSRCCVHHCVFPFAVFNPGRRHATPPDETEELKQNKTLVFGLLSVPFRLAKTLPLKTGGESVCVSSFCAILSSCYSKPPGTRACPFIGCTRRCVYRLELDSNYAPFQFGSFVGSRRVGSRTVNRKGRTNDRRENQRTQLMDVHFQRKLNCPRFFSRVLFDSNSKETLLSNGRFVSVPKRQRTNSGLWLHGQSLSVTTI